MKHVLNYLNQPIDSTHTVSAHITFTLPNGIPLAIFDTNTYETFVHADTHNPLQPLLHRLSIEIAPFGETIDACTFQSQVIRDAQTGELLLQLDLLSAFLDKHRENRRLHTPPPVTLTPLDVPVSTKQEPLVTPIQTKTGTIIEQLRLF